MEKNQNSETKTITLTIFGDPKTGKSTLSKSILSSKEENKIGSQAKKGLIEVKGKKFVLQINECNSPDRAVEMVKESNLIILCFRADDQGSFHNLFDWVELFDKTEVTDYFLLGNNYNEPYFPINDIETECKEFNDCNKVPYVFVRILDFNAEVEVQSTLKTIIDSNKFSMKTSKVDKNGESCVIF